MKSHCIAIMLLLLFGSDLYTAEQVSNKQKTETQAAQQNGAQFAGFESLPAGVVVPAARAVAQGLVVGEEKKQEYEKKSDMQLELATGKKRKNFDIIEDIVDDPWLECVTVIPDIQRIIREYYISPLEYLPALYNARCGTVFCENDDESDYHSALINKNGMLFRGTILYNIDGSIKHDFSDEFDELAGVADYSWDVVLREDNKIIFIPKEGDEPDEEQERKFGYILNDDGSLYKKLEGHRDNISCVAINKDNIVVTGSLDKTVRVWNADGALIKSLDASCLVTDVAISDDGVIVCGCAEGSCRVWKKDLSGYYDLKGHKSQIDEIVMHSGDCFVTRSQAQFVGRKDLGLDYLVLWKFNKNNAIPALPPYTSKIIGVSVTEVAFGVDSFVTGSRKMNDDLLLEQWTLDGIRMRSMRLKGAHGCSLVKITSDNSVVVGTSSSNIIWCYDGVKYNFCEGEYNRGSLNIDSDDALYINERLEGLRVYRPQSEWFFQLHDLPLSQIAPLRTLLNELEQVRESLSERLRHYPWAFVYDPLIDGTRAIIVSRQQADVLYALHPVLQNNIRQHFHIVETGEDFCKRIALIEDWLAPKQLMPVFEKLSAAQKGCFQVFVVALSKMRDLSLRARKQADQKVVRYAVLPNFVLTGNQTNLIRDLPEVILKALFDDFNIDTIERFVERCIPTHGIADSAIIKVHEYFVAHLQSLDEIRLNREIDAIRSVTSRYGADILLKFLQQLRMNRLRAIALRDDKRHEILYFSEKEEKILSQLPNELQNIICSVYRFRKVAGFMDERVGISDAGAFIPSIPYYSPQ